MKKERLDKILSHCGYGSRKDVKSLVRKGFVEVNGQVCLNFEFGIDSENDVILVDRKKLNLRRNIYLMLNKPQNVVTSTKDGLHQTVLDLISDEYKVNFLGGNLHPVGRLDIDTEGLLFLTTDGSLTHFLISPKSHVQKTYFARLRDSVSVQEQSRLTGIFAKGFEVVPEGNETSFVCEGSKLVWLDENSVELTIHEGKYHQVKRMFRTFGNEVVFLKRISVGNIALDKNLALGEYRELRQDEIDSLLA